MSNNAFHIIYLLVSYYLIMLLCYVLCCVVVLLCYDGAARPASRAGVLLHRRTVKQLRVFRVKLCVCGM